MPYPAVGTYYGIGMSTFEPTMGITQSDTLFMSSYGNGPAGSTAVVACDLIGMTETLDYSCENVYDPFFPIANSNDPYIYVDPWTSRIMKFDMHALLGMTVEWSDDDGASWNGPSVATQIYSVQDHQTIASSNMPAMFIRRRGCSASTATRRIRCALQAKTAAPPGGRKPPVRRSLFVGRSFRSPRWQHRRQLLPRQQGLHG